MDRYIGNLRANLDQGDAQIALLVGQAGISRSQGACHYTFHVKMRALDCLDQIPDRRAIGKRNMHIHPKRFGMQPDRICHPLGTKPFSVGVNTLIETIIEEYSTFTPVVYRF